MNEGFWSRVEVGEPDACWRWTGSVQTRGYGILDRTLAHRLSYEIHKGAIPEGLLVRHACDNKLCVNPAHLLVGTAQDNTNDMIERGRLVVGRKRTGEDHHRVKLSDADVASIRAAGGVSQAALARRYGVWSSTVSAIVRGASRKEPSC